MNTLSSRIYEFVMRHMKPSDARGQMLDYVFDVGRVESRLFDADHAIRVALIEIRDSGHNIITDNTKQKMLDAIGGAL